MANDTVVLTQDLDPVEMSVRVYSVSCACGASLKYAVDADRDNDLTIEVDAHICEQEEE